MLFCLQFFFKSQPCMYCNSRSKTIRTDAERHTSKSVSAGQDEGHAVVTCTQELEHLIHCDYCLVVVVFAVVIEPFAKLESGSSQWTDSLWRKHGFARRSVCLFHRESNIWNLKINNNFSSYFSNICEFVLNFIHYLFSINESFDYFPWWAEFSSIWRCEYFKDNKLCFFFSQHAHYRCRMILAEGKYKPNSLNWHYLENMTEETL